MERPCERVVEDIATIEEIAEYVGSLIDYCDSLEVDLHKLSSHSIRVEEDNKGLLCKVNTLNRSLATAKTRTDYWCTQCTEARMRIKLLKQDIERRKRETTI